MMPKDGTHRSRHATPWGDEPRPGGLPETSPGLSVVIPAYDEEGAIDQVVESTRAIVGRLERELGLPGEVLVVDDGSTDETCQRAEGHAGVRCIRHRVNRGYGAALKTGLRNARYDLVAIIDADGTYPAERLPELCRLLLDESLDMVVGARTGSDVAIPRVRRPAKWMLAKLAGYVAGEPIPDLNSGFRVFRRSTALRFLSLLPDGFSFTTTITLAMLGNGYRVAYQPIDYAARIGRSKIHPLRDTLAFLQLVARIALYFAPLKVFLPMSAVLLLSSVAVAAVSHWALGRLADVSTVVLFMAGLQIAAIGLLAELIVRRLPNFFREGDR